MKNVLSICGSPDALTVMNMFKLCSTCLQKSPFASTSKAFFFPPPVQWYIHVGSLYSEVGSITLLVLTTVSNLKLHLLLLKKNCVSWKSICGLWHQDCSLEKCSHASKWCVAFVLGWRLMTAFGWFIDKLLLKVLSTGKAEVEVHLRPAGLFEKDTQSFRNFSSSCPWAPWRLWIMWACLSISCHARSTRMYRGENKSQSSLIVTKHPFFSLWDFISSFF